LVVDPGKLNLLAIVLTVVALGCGRTGLDDGFGIPNTPIGVAPDSGASATAGVGGHGGTLGAGGHSAAAGSGSASTGNTETVGGFNGTIRFCSSDLDCVASAPRCCPVGVVKVCEPPPCASNDEDNDDDSTEGHRR
jgi:hypothetical protein